MHRSVRASPRRGWRPVRAGPGWWQPAVNRLGCIFFGVSAIAGYVSRGSVLDLAAANWNTALGAACFPACAVGTFIPIGGCAGASPEGTSTQPREIEEPSA